MSLALYFAFCFFIGVLFLRTLSPQGRHLEWLALPAGVHITCSSAIVLGLLGLPVRLSLACGLGIAFGGAAMAFRSSYWLQVRSWKRVVIGTVAMGLITLLIDQFRVVVMTHDSHSMLILGRSVLMAESLNPEFVRQASSVGPLSMILQGFSFPLDRDVIDSASLLNLLGTYGFIFMVGREYVKSQQQLLLGILLLALAPQPFMFFSYVHSNPIGAVFFSASLMLFWRYVDRRDVGDLTVGVLMLLGYTLTRFEGPVFFAMVLFFIGLDVSRQDLRSFMFAVIPSSLLIGWWSLYVDFNKGEGIEGFSTSGQFYILLFAALVPIFYFILPRISAQLRARAVNWTSISLGLINALMAIKKPGFILGGAFWVSTVLFDPRYWGLFWYAVVPAGVYLIWRNREEKTRRFAHIVLSYFLIISIFGYFRELTYQPFWSDSAVRMSFHIAPFLVFLLAYGLTSATDQKGHLSAS